MVTLLFALLTMVLYINLKCSCSIFICRRRLFQTLICGESVSELDGLIVLINPLICNLQKYFIPVSLILLIKARYYESQARWWQTLLVSAEDSGKNGEAAYWKKNIVCFIDRTGSRNTLKKLHWVNWPFPAQNQVMIGI